MVSASVTEEGPHVLTPAYYQRLRDLEEVHGWALGMRAMAGALVGPLLAGGRDLRILDAGCGTGGMLAWLQRPAVGLDLSSDALRFCRQRGQDGLAQASAQVLPFRDQSFDLVLSTDVIQHLPDPPGDGAALAEAYRVLRPGGHLFIRTNSSFGMGEAAGPLQADYRRYARPDLEARVRSAGFGVVRSTYANCLPSLLAIARRRLRDGPPVAVRDAGLRVRVRAPALRWLDWALFAVLRGEAWYVQHAGRDLPFGHSLVILARKPMTAVGR